MKRTLTIVFLLAVIGVMTGLVSYSVTIYRLFCQVTGAGGTTQRASADTEPTLARTVTVYFDTNVAPGLPWRFVPLQHSIKVHLGEQALVYFEAENLSANDIVGHATFNVTPDKVGVYFKKIECFCFTEERLEAHKKVDMPVTFFVDPRLADDRGTADVDEITLSYTFFRSARPEGAEDMARFGPVASAQNGKTLFESQCAGCHGIDTARAGPPLAGVVGRTAGAASGYPYSLALAQSGLVWSETTLDRWLAGPQTLVPGALMPMSVPDESARRDIIAYLKTLGTARQSEGSAAKPPPG